MQPDEAHSLAARAIEGDPDAIRDLWRQHRRWVAAILLAHMPRDADVDDLLQEVAMAVLRNISALREPRLFRSWLRTIAMNTARTAARKRNVRLRLVGAEPLDESRVSAPQSASPETRELAHRALALARELHADYSEPLLMRCTHGMTYRQIAAAMGVPVTTIETRLARARKMLRARLDEEEAKTAPNEPASEAAS